MILAPIPPADPADPPRPPARPFVAPPGGVPPFDTYDGSRHNLLVGRHISEHWRELAGMHVAWAFDGSFLHAAPTGGELIAALYSAGVGRECYITDYIESEPLLLSPILQADPEA